MKPAEHYVFMIADKALLTAEKRDEIDHLFQTASAEVPGIISNKVTYNEQPDGSTAGIVTSWIFENEEARDAFRASRAHQAHLKSVMPAILEKFVWDC